MFFYFVLANSFMGTNVYVQIIKCLLHFEVVSFQSYLDIYIFRDGYGLWLDAELTNGTSARCQTFLNKPLTNNNDGTFVCACIELYALIDSQLYPSICKMNEIVELS